MKRFLAFVLDLFIMMLILTGCSRPIYSVGDNKSSSLYDIYAKVNADKRVFNKNDVVLDFFYAFYCLDEKGMEEIIEDNSYAFSKGDLYTHYETVYAIYVSKNSRLEFEEGGGYLREILDYENKVNAQLIKFISFEEAYSGNYGYTTASDSNQLNYTHSEKIMISSDLFDSSTGSIYIHIYKIYHNLDDGKYYNYFVDTKSRYYTRTIEIKYRVVGKKVMLF